MKIVCKFLIALPFACLLSACGSVLQQGTVRTASTAAGAAAKHAPAELLATTNTASSPGKLAAPSILKTAYRFEDYAVADSFRGPAPKLTFSTKTKRFRSRLSAAASEPPNFAGHFILTRWGCGTDCQMGGVIDARTGRTTLIPFTVCCSVDTGEDIDMMDFRPDSSLILFNGLLDENENGGRQHAYVFENGNFILIASDADGTW